MAETEHTPGPWRVVGPNQILVKGSEPDGMGGSIPFIVAHCNVTGELPPDVDVANARLIATAPELLEACKAAYSYILGNSRPSKERALRLLLDSMKKAEGRQ